MHMSIATHTTAVTSAFVAVPNAEMPFFAVLIGGCDVPSMKPGDISNICGPTKY